MPVVRRLARRVPGFLRRAAIALPVAALAPLGAALAQGSAAKPIPVRQLAPAVSTDSGVVGSTDAVRVLADGRVLLNDVTQHRLLLVDTTLKRYTIVADNAGNGSHPFGNGQGGLLPFSGDSTAWIDAESKALLVIDGKGQFGVAIAPLNANELRLMTGGAIGVPGFDASGRLFYRAAIPVRLPSIDHVGPDQPDSAATLPDSAPIVRADFDKRRLDTVAYMKTPLQKVRIVRTGPVRGMPSFLNPLPWTDEWAYLPDGTIAIVRGHDYHVDWVSPDGTRRSSPKMSFDWRRITDEDKQRMIDSTQRVADSVYSVTRAAFRAVIIPAADLPDYYPPIRPQQIRVDLSGNLWVIPSTSLAATNGGNVFDVINRNGEIIERVQLPAGRNLAGFGPGGTVYMSVPAQAGWARLERARIVRN